MAVSSSLQSKIIISAQDRGLSTLLKKLSGEADATVNEFSRLGAAVSQAIGGIGAGLAIKKVSDWIEEYKMSAMSIATMFTDTMRGSGRDLNEVFDQNRRHAEAFFRVLQQQSAKSLSSMDDLMQAYTMLANYGRSLSPTMKNAELLANVVDRIRLATKGQNQDIQVLQELRALLNGQSRPSDALARMLRQRDANFSSTLSTMVTGGASAEEILKYINSLFSNVDNIGKHLSRSLTKSLELLKGNVKLLAIDAFTPLHDEAARAVAGVAELFDPSSANSPLRRSLESMSSAVQEIFGGFAAIGEGVSSAWASASESLRDITRGFASELIPRLATTLTTVMLIAKGFATIKGLVAAIARTNLTLTGMAAIAYGTYAAVDSFKDSTRPISVTDYTPSDRSPDWEWVKGYVTDTFNVIKAAFVAAAGEVFKVVVGAVTAIAGTASEVISVMIDGFRGVWTSLVDFSAKTHVFFENLDRSLPAVIELAKYAFDMVVYNFKALGVMLYNGMIDAVNKTVTTVVGLADDLVAKLANTFVGIADMFQKVLSNLTFGKYQPRSIPRYQTSTNYDSLKIGEGSRLEYPRRPQRPSVTFPSMSEDTIGVGAAANESKRYIRELLSPLAESFREWGRGANSGLASDLFMYASPENVEKHFFSLWNESRKEWADRYRNSQRAAAAASGSTDAITGNPKTVYDINGSSLKLANSMGNEIERLLRSVIQTGTAMDKASIAMESVSGNSNEYAAKLMSMDKELSSLQMSIGSISEGSGLISKGTEELLDSYRKLREEVAAANSEYQRLKSTGEDTESTVGKLNKSLTELHKVMPQLQESLKAELEKGREEAAKQIELLRERQNVERDYLMEMTRLKDEGTFSSGLEAGAKSYAHDNRTSDFGEGLRVATETLNNFSSSVSDALYNMMIEGTASLRDVIASFGQSIVRTITDSIARQLTEQLASGLVSVISTLTGFEFTTFSASAALEASSDLLSVSFFGAETAANALTASFSAAAIAIDAAASTIGVSSLLGGAAIPAAKGAVWSGGFTPIMAFARGGVATRPTIGLIGEAGQNEAIVPLPDGRRIPVEMRGGNGVGVSVTVNVVNNAGVGVETQRRETDDGTVIDIILDAANRNRRGFRSVMRSALGVGK